MQLSLLDQPGLRAWSTSSGRDSRALGANVTALRERGAVRQGARLGAAQHLDQHLESGADQGTEPGARRIDLGRGAWVELVPNWLGEQAALFELLVRTADWEQHRRTMYDRVVEVPRLVAGLPGDSPASLAVGAGSSSLVERYRHRAPAREVRAAAGELRSVAVTLSHRYQRTLTDVSLAYYRDGHDSVAYHSDKLGAGRTGSEVAILSLGARRRFLLRPVHALGGEETLTFELGEGDLLVMGGTCQEVFEHAIPKAKFAGPHIAVMFRQAQHSLARPAEERPSLRLVR